MPQYRTLSTLLTISSVVTRDLTLALPAPPPYPSPVAVNPATGFDSPTS